MHLAQVVGLALRLFAVFLVVYNLRYANSLLGFALGRSPDYLGSVLIVFLGFVPTFVAVVLWLFPLAIASKLIPNAKINGPEVALTPYELQNVAFSVLGLWVLATAIPDALYWIVIVYLAKVSAVGQPELSSQNMAAIFETAVEVALGFWLLLGSEGIVGLVRRMKR